MRLSIFGRTLVLSVILVVVAEAIGFLAYFWGSSIDTPPVTLMEIERQLSAAPCKVSEPAARCSNRDATRRGPPPGLPQPGQSPSDAPPDRAVIFPAGDAPNTFGTNWLMRTEGTPPAPPAQTDEAVSFRLKGLLADRLGARPDTVHLYVSRMSGVGIWSLRTADELRLQKGFTAALRQSDGTWRTLVGEDQQALRTLQWRGMLVLALGLLVLAPIGWIFARSLATPLRRFAHAATVLGTNPHSPPLERRGPAEMQIAVDSFNSMQSRIKRLLQERAQMVAAIAHDLRTPLMRLSFRLPGLDAALRSKIEADINEMKLMISATMDFVRDQSALGTRERLDFRLLVESVVDDQSDLGRDVILLEAAPVTMTGDPLALRRAISNVVENAVRYGERARVRLRGNLTGCTLLVDDDGPGIPDNLQQRVFEPFFRIDGSRGRDTGGIGLGLATVRSIILDHGGEISLSNREDGGLRVSIALPIQS